MKAQARGPNSIKKMTGSAKSHYDLCRNYYNLEPLTISNGRCWEPNRWAFHRAFGQPHLLASATMPSSGLSVAPSFVCPCSLPAITVQGTHTIHVQTETSARARSVVPKVRKHESLAPRRPTGLPTRTTMRNLTTRISRHR